MKMHKDESGVTLVELLITLSIASILIAIATPSLTTVVKDSRLRVGANALQNSFSLARSTAVSRSAFVTICKSTNGTECAAAGDWSQGWIIYEGTIDDDPVQGSDDERIRVNRALNDQITFRGEPGLANYASFDGLGFTRDSDGDYQSGLFHICDDRGTAGRTRIVFLAAAGSSRVGDPPDGLSCEL
jgi:type IV fimbrial biogenesis protein FimT